MTCLLLKSLAFFRLKIERLKKFCKRFSKLFRNILVFCRLKYPLAQVIVLFFYPGKFLFVIFPLSPFGLVLFLLLNAFVITLFPHIGTLSLCLSYGVSFFSYFAKSFLMPLLHSLNIQLADRCLKLFTFADNIAEIVGNVLNNFSMLLGCICLFIRLHLIQHPFHLCKHPYWTIHNSLRTNEEIRIFLMQSFPRIFNLNALVWE